MLNGHAARGPASEQPISLLLAEPDPFVAEFIEQRLRRTLPALAVTRCDTLAAARAYLSGTVFDAVCTAAELPDGSGLALLDVLSTLQAGVPSFVRTGEVTAGQIADAAACFALETDDSAFAHMEYQLGCLAGTHQNGVGLVGSEEPVAPEPIEAAGWLEALRLETGVVAHAINNPLTVITGNAQLLREMARTADLDPMVAKPIEDIEVAAQQLSGALERLAALRQQLADVLGSDDTLGAGNGR